MKYEKNINCNADNILQMLVLNWYIGWCTMFLSVVGRFLHSPSSGKIMNNGVCEGRESAHAQFRPERIIVNFMWWCFMTWTSFSTENPHKYKISMSSNIHFLTFITMKGLFSGIIMTTKTQKIVLCWFLLCLVDFP